MVASFFGLGPWELVIIIAILVILFLPSLIPKIAKRFGQSVSSIRELAENIEKKPGDEEPKDTEEKKKE